MLPSDTSPHWSSPEGIRRQAEQRLGVFGAYDDMLANDDPAHMEGHNAQGGHGAFCAEAFAFLTGRAGVFPQRIADVGCGAGFLSDRLRHLFPNARIDACDASESAIRYGRKHFPTINFMCAVVEADAALPAGGEGYDLIVVNEFYPLSRVADVDMHQGLIRTFLRSLAPGGIIFCNQAIVCDCINKTLPVLRERLAQEAVLSAYPFPRKGLVRWVGMNRLAMISGGLLVKIFHKIPVLCLQIQHRKN